MTDDVMHWDQLVVVCAPHGEKFLGWVPPPDDLKELGAESPRDYMLHCLSTGVAAELREVRILASQLQVTPDPTGQGIGSIGNLMVLMPVDMFPQGMEKHFVKVSTFYFPADNEDCKPMIEKLLTDARQMEFRRGAQQAGIEIPKLGMVPRGGQR